MSQPAGTANQLLQDTNFFKRIQFEIATGRRPEGSPDTADLARTIGLFANYILSNPQEAKDAGRIEPKWLGGSTRVAILNRSGKGPSELSTLAVCRDAGVGRLTVESHTTATGGHTLTICQATTLRFAPGGLLELTGIVLQSVNALNIPKMETSAGGNEQHQRRVLATTCLQLAEIAQADSTLSALHFHASSNRVSNHAKGQPFFTPELNMALAIQPGAQDVYAEDLIGDTGKT